MAYPMYTRTGRWIYMADGRERTEFKRVAYILDKIELK